MQLVRDCLAGKTACCTHAFRDDLRTYNQCATCFGVLSKNVSKYQGRQNEYVASLSSRRNMTHTIPVPLLFDALRMHTHGSGTYIYKNTTFQISESSWNVEQTHSRDPLSDYHYDILRPPVCTTWYQHILSGMWITRNRGSPVQPYAGRLHGFSRVIPGDFLRCPRIPLH